jgi:putative ABC transport system ATP-binding protein
MARALVNHPSLLLADEPTGNLDSRTGDEIMSLVSKIHAAGRTIVLVTHEEYIAVNARRIIRLRDGRVESDERVDGRGPAAGAPDSAAGVRAPAPDARG